MSAHTDELGKELRQNLELRRDLGVKAAKATAAIALEQRSRFAYRLGCFLYWACLVIALTWAGFVASIASDQADLSKHWLFGRALRFILSEE